MPNTVFSGPTWEKPTVFSVELSFSVGHLHDNSNHDCHDQVDQDEGLDFDIDFGDKRKYEEAKHQTSQMKQEVEETLEGEQDWGH